MEYDSVQHHCIVGGTEEGESRQRTHSVESSVYLSEKTWWEGSQGEMDV